MAFEGRGKNGNILVGRRSHPVRCYGADGMPIRTFGTLKSAGEWLVHNGFAGSVNSAKVGITHAINGRQHYWGHDHSCKTAFGLTWRSV